MIVSPEEKVKESRSKNLMRWVSVATLLGIKVVATKCLPMKKILRNCFRRKDDGTRTRHHGKPKFDRNASNGILFEILGSKFSNFVLTKK